MIERDSLVFYRSFYEAIKELPRDVQGEIYTAIMEYGLYGKEIEQLKPIARSIFALIKPQIDANNKKYVSGKKGGEYGHLGGRPKKENNPKETPKKPQENPKETPNVNVNENVNVNDNGNVNGNAFNEPTTNKLPIELITFWEESTSRPVTPTEMETIQSFQILHSDDVIKHAMKETVLNNVYSLSYVRSILQNYHKNKLTTLQAIESHEEKRRSKQTKKGVTTLETPKYFNDQESEEEKESRKALESWLNSW